MAHTLYVEAEYSRRVVVRKLPLYLAAPELAGLNVESICRRVAAGWHVFLPTGTCWQRVVQANFFESIWQGMQGSLL